MIKEIKTGNDTIFFNDETHRFWREEAGKKIAIPSVTTFTGIIDKSRPLIFWAVGLTKNYLLERLSSGSIGEVDIIEACKQHQVQKEQAADTGTQIHELVSRWIKGETFDLAEDLDPKIRFGFEAFLKFQMEHKVKWITSEEIIYAKGNGYEYAGILDAVGEIDGKKVLVDFKSSNALYPEYALQAAAYQHAYQQMYKTELDHRLIIRFGKEDGEFEIKKYDCNEADIKTFLACITVKNRLKELESYPV